jgi:hypothetical protein
VSELADYGYDAPYALVIFAVIGSAVATNACSTWAVDAAPY